MFPELPYSNFIRYSAQCVEELVCIFLCGGEVQRGGITANYNRNFEMDRGCLIVRSDGEIVLLGDVL